MDDVEFLSILADTNAGLDPGVGWEPVHVHAAALIAERDRLRTDVDEYDDLLLKLSRILTGTADALKGEPGPLRMHDWSDLAVVAAGVMGERNRQQHQRQIIDAALRDTVAERDRLQTVTRGAVVAIETVLIGDHVDMKIGISELLGRTSASLKQALGEGA